jgi:hypothetical protein
MLIIKHTVPTTVTPQQIWHVWQDVSSWKTWDHDLESAHIHGPFQSGTVGYLKFKDSPQFKTVLTCVEPFKMFVQELQLFGAKVVMTHSIDQADEKTFVTFQTEIKGLLALIFACLLGRSIKKKIPLEMEEMIKVAEAFKD